MSRFRLPVLPKAIPPSWRHPIFAAGLIVVILVASVLWMLARTLIRDAQLDDTLKTRASVDTLVSIYIARQYCQDIDAQVTKILNTARDFYEEDIAPLRRGISNCVRAAIAKDIYAHEQKAQKASANAKAAPDAAFASAMSRDEMLALQAEMVRKEAEKSRQRAAEVAAGLRALKQIQTSGTSDLKEQP